MTYSLSVRKEKSFPLAAKHSLIPKYLLQSHLAHMVASRRVVALVCLRFPFSRSVFEDFSLASKFMIDTGAGVVDADYRGVVFVLLFNLSDKDFQGA
jgi:dUTPase